jgi:hypothetical protein
VYEPQDETEDRGAHGAFDSKAHEKDPWTWASMHRRALLGGSLATAAAGVVGAVRAARR